MEKGWALEVALVIFKLHLISIDTGMLCVSMPSNVEYKRGCS